MVVSPDGATLNTDELPTLASMTEKPVVAVETIDSMALLKLDAEFVSVSVLAVVPISEMLALHRSRSLPAVIVAHQK